MTWRPAPILTSLILVPLLVLSCSYDSLCFFFDGVPEPGSEEVAPEPPPDEEVQAPTRSQSSSHAPVQQQKCRSCHLRKSFRTLRTAADGLCAGCHENLTANLRYVHGPVAVSACDFCHHPHGSPNPHLLLQPPTELCVSCHEPGDLGEGEHHDPDSAVACTECHSGHGGEDPYFLK